MERIEAMEVDLQQGGPSREPGPGSRASLVELPIIIPDSDSETEVEDEADAAPRDPPRLPTTWAFSQNRVVVEGQLEPSIRMEQHLRATFVAALRHRRARSMHHHTQFSTRASRFLLRVPAANQGEADSGSTTEGSETDDEAPAPTANPSAPAVPSSPPLNPPVDVVPQQSLRVPEAVRTEAVMTDAMREAVIEVMREAARTEAARAEAARAEAARAEAARAEAARAEAARAEAARAEAARAEAARAEAARAEAARAEAARAEAARAEAARAEAARAEDARAEDARAEDARAEDTSQLNPGRTAGTVASNGTSPQPSSQGDDGDTCPVCFEPYCSAGTHRLATLRCGHLFGHACIHRWVKSQGHGAKCPQCNRKAKRSDITVLYARKLTVMDNSEQERMKRLLDQEQSQRRNAELESAQCRLQLQVMTDECGKLRKQLQDLQHGCGPSQSSGSSHSGFSQRQDSTNGGQYVFSKAVLVSQAGGCRVLSYCEPLSCLLASQPSPHTNLVPGWGVKKVSTMTLKGSQYVPIHARQIRGLSFNRQADSLMLSASLDCTIKLTSLMTNTVVQTYNTGKPVWSCCWCLDNNNYVYAGLSNGSVLLYDTRDTSTHVQELPPLRSRCPVASLCYVPRAASRTFPCSGLIAGSLEGGCFWEQVDGTTYRPHVLPLETGGCTDIQVEPESRHCLVTYRPGRSNPSLRCVLMELNRAPQLDAAQVPLCSCNPVQIFNAGSSCKLLTKNAVFRSPSGDGSNLVCAGDEATNSTMVWNAASGSLIQKLPADLPVLDICPYEMNQSSYLAALTEKMLKIYKWE